MNLRPQAPRLKAPSFGEVCPTRLERQQPLASKKPRAATIIKL